MVFNKSLPSGQKAIALLDDDVRLNNEATQTAFDAEHEFVDNDAVQQTGLHKFPVGAAGAFPGKNLAGRLAIENALDPRGVLYWNDGSAWQPLINEDPDAVKSTDSYDWDQTQFSTWETITSTAGALAIDPVIGAFQQITLLEPVTLSINTGLVQAGTVLTLNVNSGTGGFAITWDAQFRAQGGVVQYSQAAGTETLFIFTHVGGDTWLATSVPNWNVGGVTSVGA